MKKIIAILLSLALMLSCAAGLAESSGKQIFGSIRANGDFTLKGILPEGYKIIPFELSDNAILSHMVSEDPAKPQMVLSIAFDELYADVERLNDLDDDELIVLEKTFSDTDPYAVITYDETAYGTRLLECRTISNHNDYLDIFSIYNGYCIEFVMTPGEGSPDQRLTDEDVALCNEFLSELDFISGIETEELVLAGNSFTADITSYDAEAKTVDVTLLTPYTFTEWQVVSINEGDTITIGTEEVEIGTLAYDGDDAVINDEYYFTKREDGLYTASSYDMPILKEAVRMTLAVPDSLVFTDGVDPSSGEILEEAATKTAEELFSALAQAGEGWVGFDSQNITVTFDANGALESIRRDYVPWQ